MHLGKATVFNIVFYQTHLKILNDEIGHALEYGKTLKPLIC